MAIFTYSDGNQNSYRLQNSLLKYSPMKKENSSSGMYDGGSPKERTLTAAENEQLVNLFQKVIEKASPVANRQMGTSRLSRLEGEQRESRILRYNSAFQKEINTMLKSLLPD